MLQVVIVKSSSNLPMLEQAKENRLGVSEAAKVGGSGWR